MRIFFLTVLLAAGCVSFALPVFAVDVSTSSGVTVTAVVSGDTTTTGGGGGGGGGGGSPTSITFSGRAYPLSRVILLKDGQEIINTVSGPDARFSVSVSNLAVGTFTFSILSEDNTGRRSILFTIPISVTAGVSSIISGIFLAPTIDVDKRAVRQGDPITIFGVTAPGSEVTITVNSLVPHLVSTRSDESGAYFYTFNTAPLEYGHHNTQSKAEITSSNETTSFGTVVSFDVGDVNIAKNGCDSLRGDFNADCRVNLIDFSIISYWYKRLGFPKKVDLNSDGKVSFVDFSIVAYYWTG